MTAAQEFAEKSLDEFKDRMRISTTDENELNNLKKMLDVAPVCKLNLLSLETRCLYFLIESDLIPQHSLL